MYGDRGTTIAWGGVDAFGENDDSANGGAVAFVSHVSLDLGAVGATFSLTGNVVDISGGAVFQSGVRYGLTWKGVKFTPNCAMNGGAMYSAATAIVVESSTELLTVYINCIFRDNTAAASGGAVESAAGKDTFLYTTFHGANAGAVGGGLRLARTTTLTSCNFVGNGANAAGPAVANVGTIAVANSSFTNNCLLCTPGAFLNYTIQASNVDKVPTCRY